MKKSQQERIKDIINSAPKKTISSLARSILERPIFIEDRQGVVFKNLLLIELGRLGDQEPIYQNIADHMLPALQKLAADASVHQLSINELSALSDGEALCQKLKIEYEKKTSSGIEAEKNAIAAIGYAGVENMFHQLMAQIDVKLKLPEQVKGPQQPRRALKPRSERSGSSEGPGLH